MLVGTLEEAEYNGVVSRSWRALKLTPVCWEELEPRTSERGGPAVANDRASS